MIKDNVRVEENISKGIMPETRRKALKRIIKEEGFIRILEAHNGLTGLIVEKTKIRRDNEVKEFGGMWVSSLCDSTAKGKPDIELVDFTSRTNTINDIMEVTTKPIIVDGDTGGEAEHLKFTVKTLERLGVSAIVIEDKVGLKKNSLFGVDVSQTQASIEEFSNKISLAKKSLITDDFMIIARIESLILEKGMDDALERAKAYIEAGSDGIMIHSRESSGDEIKEFCNKYNKFENRVPLLVVPTTYNHISEKELKDMGVNIVVYANHLLRSAYPAMVKAAESILDNERSFETNDLCMPIKEILTLIPGGE
ncbi:phosphoenolpyruvate mutase [Clostridium bornimense]|nr:phosphoenolpyruvate mutase [Clostridium bornimense]